MNYPHVKIVLKSVWYVQALHVINAKQGISKNQSKVYAKFIKTRFAKNMKMINA